MDTVFFLLILILLGFSAFFSSSETALFSLSTIKLKAYLHDADPRKRLIAHLVLHPRDLLVTVFMLNTLVNILLQNVASSMIGESYGWFEKVVFPLVLTLIIGEIIPKYYGLQYNISISYFCAPLISWLQDFLKPLRVLIVYITTPISRKLFFFLEKEKEISRDELKHVLQTSETQGVLKPDETVLVWGYLDLQESSVKELMRPREDILSYEIHEPLSKLTHLFAEKRKSYIPVYEKEINNILGIISAKQYFLNHQQIASPKDIQLFLRRPFYVPENMSGKALLRRMQRLGQTLAVVVDEYSSIAGVVSFDDILEVAIGKSTEEKDTKPLYSQAGEGKIIASGKLELSVINEFFNTSLTSEKNMLTLGGWLTEKLGDIPKSGQQYQTDVLFFQVLSADQNRVRRVYIRKSGRLSEASKKKK